MCQSGITPIVHSAVIEYASYGAMNADVGTEAPGTDDSIGPAVVCGLLPRLRCSLTVRLLRELVCLTTCEVCGLRGCVGQGRGKNQEWYEEQAMKKIVVWGGLLLALGTMGRLLWQVRRVSSVPGDVPVPLPPCMYTYKDVTVSLN